jgi:hypothetical protein
MKDRRQLGKTRLPCPDMTRDAPEGRARVLRLRMPAELGAAALSLTGRNPSGAGPAASPATRPRPRYGRDAGADRQSSLISFRREPPDHPHWSSELERVVRRGLVSGYLAGVVALIRVRNCGVTFGLFRTFDTAVEIEKASKRLGTCAR